MIVCSRGVRYEEARGLHTARMASNMLNAIMGGIAIVWGAEERRFDERPFEISRTSIIT
jgi:hypothetical protein